MQSWLITFPWNTKKNTGLLSCLCRFLHISRLKPTYPCQRGLSRLTQVKDTWLAEIPYLEEKSWSKRCPATLLILLWDAASDSDSADSNCSPSGSFGPGHWQGCALLIASEVWSLSTWELCRPPGRWCGVKSIYWDAFEPFTSLRLFLRWKNSNWTWRKVSEVSL